MKRTYRSEDVAEAERNGINYETFTRRVRNGWTVEEAKTRPLSGRRSMEKVRYAQMAAENGVSDNTFGARLKAGWTLEKAATTPILNQKSLDADLIQKAERNGISYALLYNRIRKGWNEERAATEKVEKPKEDMTDEEVLEVIGRIKTMRKLNKEFPMTYPAPMVERITAMGMTVDEVEPRRVMDLG
ncbi:hypothetical protein GCM10022378_11370 [Salinicoccus jeotgali]|uniref:Uncharacterized protein n=1 Tax=Salinicoccus jeotgali TaxID=381634 RepID=A0ABP7ES82_9STAP